jgi:hypothetical protein
MYSLLQERNQIKALSLQALLIGISSFSTEGFVEFLVKEKRIFPESFVLESIIFLTVWFGLDLFISSILRSKSLLQSFTNQTVAKHCLTTLAVAWIIAAVFFKFYSFILEFSAMLVLWFLLDFLSRKVSRKTLY